MINTCSIQLVTPLITHFIMDSSPEQSMLCNAMSRSGGVSGQVEDCSPGMTNEFYIHLCVVYTHTLTRCENSIKYSLDYIWAKFNQLGKHSNNFSL